MYAHPRARLRNGEPTLAVAEAFPEASFTLVDASSEMLAVAKSRLGPEREVSCVESRFEELDFEPGSFDLVTSCIAIHHVVDKAALFRVLHAVLESGGHLVYCDQMAGGTDAYHAINWNRMTDYWKLPDHLREDEQRSLAEHADAHDHYVSVIEQLRHLEAAGFADLDCVWRNWMWGVLSARA